MTTKKHTIDSRIRQSQNFCKLTFRQRDLWQGIIAVADDQGRLPGLAAYVRSTVWPYDDVPIPEVENDLHKIEEIGSILRYEVDGSVYIQIVNWWKYQQPQWAGPSVYPPPPGWIDRMRYTGKKHVVISENWDMPGGFCGTAPAKEIQDTEEREGENSNSPDLPGDLSGDLPPVELAENQVVVNVKDNDNFSDAIASQNIHEGQDGDLFLGKPNGKVRKRGFEAMHHGMTKDSALKEQVEKEFRVMPNWNRKDWKACIQFLKARPPTELIQTFAEWWKREDWRGKQGQSPTPTLIQELWPQAFAQAGPNYIVDSDGGIYG